MGSRYRSSFLRSPLDLTRGAEVDETGLMTNLEEIRQLAHAMTKDNLTIVSSSLSEIAEILPKFTSAMQAYHTLLCTSSPREPEPLLVQDTEQPGFVDVFSDMPVQPTSDDDFIDMLKGMIGMN